MAKAIRSVLPHSHRRLCVWHMNQNAIKHLGGVVTDYKKFNADFRHCIYDIEEEDEFISAWNEMLDKYGLRDNAWLQSDIEEKVYKVLDINNIKHIPQQYILKRWTIDAKVLDITSNCNLHEDRKTILTKRYKELCRMFIQIAARAAESEESYLMAANYMQRIAEEVEKCLKHRSDPDIGNSVCSQVADSNNITTTSSEQNERPTKPKGMKVKEKTARGSNRHPDIFTDPNINSSTSSEQNEGFANPTERNINSCTSSKQNKGLAKPKGIKLKEKTIQGASRPIGGLEKAKSKRTRKVDNPVALQPHGSSMGHSEVFTNQMPAYLPQYNPILNPMTMYGQDQRLPAELQHYNSLMGNLGVPTNHVYTYSEQCNSALDASLLPSLVTMRGHPAPNVSLQPTVGTMRGHPTLNASLQSSIGTMNQAPNASLQPSVGQNQVFFQQQKPT
ncbi:hypothetical protein TRIUR3_01195 [Triticum urartu]|uniref:Protein FAR1-RELATED SEQUENCE n=1 Tax=Triticum urartu TaxID=4572 RepID=M8AFY9_TRIUA|nr:hypothetical protein TRIUR3_01195 [Triticum urartu]